MDMATHEQVCKRYWDIRERGQADPEYARLRKEAARLELLYEAAAAQLPESQREAVELYLTCRESMVLRLLELACEVMAPSC